MTTRIVLTLIAATAFLNADTLVLRNGNTVEGTFIDGGNRAIRIAVGNQVNTYSLSDIDSIRFGAGQSGDNSASVQNANDSPRTYPPVPAQASSNPPQNPAVDNPPPPAPAPPANGPADLEIPAGTELVVRLIDDVNSERDNLGETYRATVDQPVVVNGQTAIPRGADVVASLIDAQKSGKIEGKTVLTLDLKKLTINGRTYDIVTTGVPEASSSRGARSAKVIGGAAALGAIIGAAAGGGKGAAIGAGSGAAVGTAAQVATSGQKVKIPAETRLTFTLQNPLDL